MSETTKRAKAVYSKHIVDLIEQYERRYPFLIGLRISAQEEYKRYKYLL